MTGEQNTKRIRRMACIVIAILILLVGLAITAYCYFWNHKWYDPRTDLMSEFEHGVVYEYYTAAIIALPTCILLAGSLILFSNDMKKLAKALIIIVIVAVLIALVAGGCFAGSGADEFTGGGGSVRCPKCGTSFRSGHSAANFVQSHGYCYNCGG